MSPVNKGSTAKTSREYHKGEWCPYAKAMGRSPVLCQEGYCDQCQILLDYSVQEKNISHSRGSKAKHDG